MVNGIYRSDTGTRTATFEPMLAEDHMALYREEETGDVIAVSYVLDRTEHYRLEEKERALEKSNREYAKLLEEEKKHTVMIEELTKNCKVSWSYLPYPSPAASKSVMMTRNTLSNMFQNNLQICSVTQHQRNCWMLQAIIEQRAKDRGIQIQFCSKRRASISFYLWKSCAFKTDIS